MALCSLKDFSVIPPSLLAAKAVQFCLYFGMEQNVSRFDLIVMEKAFAYDAAEVKSTVKAVTVC